MNTANFQESFNAASQSAMRRFGALLDRPEALLNSDMPEPALKPCVLRITVGLHRGATLKLQGPVRLGCAADNDIVLQDPGVRDHHAELRRVDGVWRLFDAEDGHEVRAIETGRRGRFERRRHGLGAAELVFSQALPARMTRQRLQRKFSRMVAPVLLCLSAILGVAVIVQLVPPVSSAHLPMEVRSLAAEGFPDVQLLATPGTQPQLLGYVDDAEALARLKRWLGKDDALGKASFQVRVGSELASRVREALADTALSVDYLSAGVVRVQGSSSNLATRERLRSLASELSGVVRIDDRVAFLEVSDTPAREHLLPVRVVDVIPGENGSFSNGNGTRYFVGGVLPDGAEVVAIRVDAIEFAVGKKNITYFIK
jgi:hypothetical protein